MQYIARDKNGVVISVGDFIAYDLKTVHNNEWVVAQVKNVQDIRGIDVLVHPGSNHTFKQFIEPSRCVIIKKD